jgi:hypothetical protein
METRRNRSGRPIIPMRDPPAKGTIRDHPAGEKKTELSLWDAYPVSGGICGALQQQHSVVPELYRSFHGNYAAP